MPEYVLKRDDGKYVAPPGQEKSYTSDIRDAQVFPSLEEANRNRCPENEQAVALHREFRHWPFY